VVVDERRGVRMHTLLTVILNRLTDIVDRWDWVGGR
jgi:hypothetical protein